MIFLFRFDITDNGINFVLNERIAEDMYPNSYPDLHDRLIPLVEKCCEILVNYKDWSKSNTIMDGNILDSNEFEVMLSKGLGKYFPEIEKQILFKDAKYIADILTEVMDRKTKELKRI